MLKGVLNVLKVLAQDFLRSLWQIGLATLIAAVALTLIEASSAKLGAVHHLLPLGLGLLAFLIPLSVMLHASNRDERTVQKLRYGKETEAPRSIPFRKLLTQIFGRD